MKLQSNIHFGRNSTESIRPIDSLQLNSSWYSSTKRHALTVCLLYHKSPLLDQVNGFKSERLWIGFGELVFNLFLSEVQYDSIGEDLVCFLLQGTTRS